MTERMEAGMGWRQALESGLYEQQKAKRDKIVEERMEALADMSEFHFSDYEAELQKSLHQMENEITTMQRAQLFADRLQGGTAAEGIEQRKEEVRRTLKIIGEFNVHERRMPKLLDRKAREDIAAKVNVEAKYVTDAIFQFQVQYAQWTFLRRERLRGRPIPLSNTELEWRWKSKPTKEFIDIMNTIRAQKKKLEESRPGYQEPPRDMHINSKQVPLKIRPYISSSYSSPERRKPAPRPVKRHRGPFLV